MRFSRNGFGIQAGKFPTRFSQAGRREQVGRFISILLAVSGLLLLWKAV